MATQSAPQSPELNLSQAIEMVAKEKGIERARLVKTIEEAILKAAQSVFGPNRELEARFNEDNGQVDLFQYMTVVDDPSDDDREIALEDAQAAGLEAELGEDLGFQIFWHQSDAKKASQPKRRYNRMDSRRKAVLPRTNTRQASCRLQRSKEPESGCLGELDAACNLLQADRGSSCLQELQDLQTLAYRTGKVLTAATALLCGFN